MENNEKESTVKPQVDDEDEEDDGPPPGWQPITHPHQPPPQQPPPQPSSEMAQMVWEIILKPIDMVERGDCSDGLWFLPPTITLALVIAKHVLSALVIAFFGYFTRDGSNGLWFLPPTTYISKRIQTCFMFMLSNSELCASSDTLSSALQISLFNLSIIHFSAHQVGQVKCGSCTVLLMYPYGASSVKCSSCHFVTEIGDHNRRLPWSVQQGQHTPPFHTVR
ncbi:hypothetical protein EZV62_026679 [Acer yangbiense]|uniref:Zinc finger LSD1-type domain-containing protein n=1 Tax=Acer yangbiense TaxID=1000413 RepID=A0A5C7GS41_9ROSI|nr:hypothetical protein EZV62_026679 [Acer yangbiense]